MENKKKYVVEYDRPNCIGAGACTAASPKFWKMNYDRDGKADLIGGNEKEDTTAVIEISEEDFEEMKASAEICPVNVIRIKKKENNEKII
ncbi:ferredoxin [Candidatus Woesearchaeota archaeon]|nr:ferredoxin [Candidatus Woesearchaeota archaeon]|tara:strand:+ start:14680 stop:14949 length:270 start_codon:yes stop_codon:yes gene_type:complete